jgi:hypothetical protein
LWHEAAQDTGSVGALAGDHQNTTLILSGGGIDKAGKTPFGLGSCQPMKVEPGFDCQLALGKPAACRFVDPRMFAGAKINRIG